MTASGSGPVVEVITSIERLRDLEEAWNELWARSPDSTSFQSPQWIIPFLTCFETGPLHAIALWHGGRLECLAIFTLDWDGTETVRARLAGDGLSDYLDGLFAPECAATAATVVLDGLLAEEIFPDLRRLPESSPFLSVLHSSGVGRIEHDEPCPVLALDTGGDELERSVPHRQIEKLRYYRRRAEKLGRLRIENATAETLQAQMTVLFELHQARWRRAGEHGVLRAPEVQRFQREATRRLLEDGRLRLFTLRIGEVPAACLLGFADRDRFSFYIGGFNPDLSAVSPGTLAVAHAVQSAIREGSSCFDFLRGRERYKYWWGAVDRPVFRARLPAVERRGAAREDRGSAASIGGGTG